MVGVHKQQLYIHSSILEKSSEFIKAAIKKCWQEGQRREITSPEENATSFKVYSNWLYTGSVAANCLEDLAHLYVLGEKLIDDTFQDDIINAMVATLLDQPPATIMIPDTPEIDTIFNNLPTGSPARRLMVDWFTACGSKWVMDEETDHDSGSIVQFHREFLLEFARNLLLKRNEDQGELCAQLQFKIPCKYHKHDKESPCGKKIKGKLFNPWWPEQNEELMDDEA